MLKDLIKIATTLDSMGLVREADQIDYMIKKIGTDSSRIEELYNDEKIMEDVKFIWNTELEVNEARLGGHELTDYIIEIMNKRDKVFAELESLGINKEDLIALREHSKRMGEMYLVWTKLHKAYILLGRSLSDLRNTKNRINRIRNNPSLNEYAADIIRIFEEKDPDTEINRYIELTKEVLSLIQKEDYNAGKEKALELLNEYRALWSNYMKDSQDHKPGDVFISLYSGILNLKEAITSELDHAISFIKDGKLMTEKQKANIESSCIKLINSQY